MRQAWGQAADLVLLSLQELGQATHWTLADDTELDPDTVRKALRRMVSVPRADRRAHIKEWTLDAEGRRRYWRPVYAYGAGPNARRPPPVGHTTSTRACVRKAVRLATQMSGNHVTQLRARRMVAAARLAGIPL
jgi:hypothetical protein